MKTITETIAGAQGLLDISYNLEAVFENYLTEDHTLFLQVLRVMEASQPPMRRSYAGTGRKPYQYQPFIRSAWAKSLFNIDSNPELINRLKTDANLRLLCGFETVPGRSTFSRNFEGWSQTTRWTG